VVSAPELDPVIVDGFVASLLVDLEQATTMAALVSDQHQELLRALAVAADAASEGVALYAAGSRRAALDAFLDAADLVFRATGRPSTADRLLERVLDSVPRRWSA
jgi:hypothetical protein